MFPTPISFKPKPTLDLRKQEIPFLQTRRKLIKVVKSERLTCSSFSSSSPPSLLFSFYFSLSFSLSASSLCLTKQQQHTALFFSFLFFSFFCFFIFPKWAGPNGPTISPSSPRGEARRSSSHHLVFMPTSRQQSSSLSFETIFVNISDGFLSV